MVSNGILPCTALELYAVRCGILHTFTAESDLSRSGSSPKLAYAWGTAKSGDLQTAARLLNRDDLVAVHVEDLVQLFRHGVADYLDEVSQDPAREATLQKQVSLWFTHLDKSIVENMVRPHTDDHIT